MLSLYCTFHYGLMCRTLKCNFAFMAQKGIQNAIDMFDNNGDLYTFEDIKLKFNVKGLF